MQGAELLQKNIVYYYCRGKQAEAENQNKMQCGGAGLPAGDGYGRAGFEGY